MIRLNRILFPTDFSRCAGQALNHAIYLTKKYEAEMHFLHAIVLHEEDPHNPAFHFPDQKEIRQRLEDLARKEMSANVEQLGGGDLDITMIQERGITADNVILEHAADNDIDLIVLGTHGRRGLGHLFLGSVAEQVVRQASCPVLTIREVEGDRAVETIEDILVPVDFSDHAKIALSHAREIARLHGARLHVLQVIEEIAHSASYATGRSSLFELVPDISQMSEKALHRFFNDAPGPEVDADFHIVEGRATHEIIQFAEERKSDLIVIATHGLTGLSHLLLGSVTQRVVRRAPCPVLTIKAFGKFLVQ